MEIISTVLLQRCWQYADTSLHYHWRTQQLCSTTIILLSLYVIFLWKAFDLMTPVLLNVLHTSQKSTLNPHTTVNSVTKSKRGESYERSPALQWQGSNGCVKSVITAALHCPFDIFFKLIQQQIFKWLDGLLSSYELIEVLLITWRLVDPQRVRDFKRLWICAYWAWVLIAGLN